MKDPPRGPPYPHTYRKRMPSIHDEAERGRRPPRPAPYRKPEPSVHDIAVEQTTQREALEQLREDIEEIKTGSHNIPPPPPGTVPLPIPLPPPLPQARVTSSPPWLRAADKKWRQVTVGALVIAATAVISVLATSATKDCMSAVDRARLLDLERQQQLHRTP